jgi:hypothetical protein
LPVFIIFPFFFFKFRRVRQAKVHTS